MTMTVKELISELKKCNPNDLVMYDPENAIKNASGGTSPEFVEDYGVDDVLIGSGTEKGCVYLVEDNVPDHADRDELGAGEGKR